MKLCPMRFDSYTWHHNPKTLEIKGGKKIVTLGVAYGSDVLQNFGEKPITISGTGELYGDNCLRQYEKLKEVYEKGNCAVLCLPKLKPMYAYFDSLSVVAQNVKDVLTYSFSFTQVNREKAQVPCAQYITVKGSTTLWDISHKYSVDIETLIELNDRIMFINDIKAGEMVRVC